MVAGVGHLPFTVISPMCATFREYYCPEGATILEGGPFLNGWLPESYALDEDEVSLSVQFPSKIF